MRNPAGFEYYPGRRLPVVCRDGITRSAVITGQADTWFSLPAAVQVTAGGKRRTVAGFLSYDVNGVCRFHAYLYRANHVFIPWTAHKPRLAAAARRLMGALTFCRGYKSGETIPLRLFSETLAIACRLYLKGVKFEGLGFLTCAVLKRLPAAVLPHLAVYFTKLAALYALHDQIDGKLITPPPPPPVA